MSKSNSSENDFIKVVFLNAANDPTWRTNPSLYIALHTADPTEAGDQTTNEISPVLYVGYDRVTVAKTAAGWTIAGGGTGSSASNTALIQFPQCTGGAGTTATYVSIGTVAYPGAGEILYSGILNAPLAISNLIQPQFAIAALAVSED
jgi:hypothetical protein